jgi:hypothetical protein
MPGTRTTSRDNSGHVLAALRDGILQHNNLVLDMELQRLVESSDTLVCWLSVGNSAFSVNPVGRGSTDTNLATGSLNYTIAGIFANKAAVAAGTAFGALGTIPQNTWGVISMEIASGGAFSFQSGAANYTTGYASEALALAAIPAPLTAKARVAVVTILTKVGSPFVVGTDALAGGATGNPASQTNYYPTFGTMTPTGNRNFVGGANGVVISNVGLGKGSTDTNLANTAFTFNANGINNIAKAAVAAGTAFGALGTVPADKWALIVAYIDAGGVVSFVSAPHNYDTGYGTEAQALADLPLVVSPANKCRMGVVTLKTKAATAFVVGTDALAGGATGNPASATNYYSQPGLIGGVGVVQVYQSGMLASQVGTGPAGVLGDLTEQGVSALVTAGV